MKGRPDPGSAGDCGSRRSGTPAHHGQPRPASLRNGSFVLDLATAVGLLAADGVASPLLGSVLLVGEVALDGALRPVAGVLPMLLLARRHGLSAALVPAANHREASLAPGLPAHPVASLPEALFSS